MSIALPLARTGKDFTSETGCDRWRDIILSWIGCRQRKTAALSSTAVFLIDAGSGATSCRTGPDKPPAQ